MAAIQFESRTSAGRAVPLDTQQVARAERLAARIHADLNALIATLPTEVKTSSALARTLEIARNSCQRSWAAAAEPEPSLQTLARLPGVQGLESLSSSWKAHLSAPPQLLINLDTSIKEFDKFVEDTAGSHAKLIARIEATHLMQPEDPTLARKLRANLVDAAAVLTGRMTTCSASVYAFRPDPADPRTLHRALAQAIIGTTISPGGLPATINAGFSDRERQSDQDDFRDLASNPKQSQSSTTIFSDFSSRPIPNFTTRVVEGKEFGLIDPTTLDKPVTVDLVTGSRSTHPMRDDAGGHTLADVWTLVDAPTKFLILDIYLHKDLDELLTPSASCELWKPDLDTPKSQSWMHALPDHVELQRLRSGIERSHVEPYPRLPELTAELFSRLGWDPDEFRALRIAVEYPIWRSGYRIHFAEPSDRQGS